ncbi:MAG: hypothetical protein ACRCV6_01160 [Formosimonas sp.]
MGVFRDKGGWVVVAVILAHAGALFGLLGEVVSTPPPIEFVETQVLLEANAPTLPQPVAAQVQRQTQPQVERQSPTPAVREKEQMPIKQTAQPAAIAPATASTLAPPTAAQPVVAAPVMPPAAKPSPAPASAAKCSQAVPLRITSDLVERNMTVRLLVRRNANGVASANLQGSTGHSSLDALIEQRARGLRFFNKGAECDGLSFMVSVALAE